MKILLTTLLILIAMPAQADSVDLYRGITPVADKQAAERRRALPESLRQVLQKLTGLRQFDDYPGVEQALGQASSMMLSYFYESKEIIDSEGAPVEELRLIALFDPGRVDSLANSLSLPVWQPERLPVETWVIIDEGRGRQILPMQWSFIWDAMSNVSEQRGLPIRWPQADEDGMYPVDAQLLWGGYTEDLAGDGRTGVMIITARREGMVWNVRTNLEYLDSNWAWRSQNVALRDELVETLHRAVDEVAAVQRIAATDLGQREQELVIADITSSIDYADCLRLLTDLSIVDKVSLVSASPGRIRFRLQLNTLPQYLAESLRSTRKLQPGEEEWEYRFKQ